jgi:protein TonB
MRLRRPALITYALSFAAAVALHAILTGVLAGAVRPATARGAEEAAAAELKALAVTFRSPEPVALAQEPTEAVTRLRQPVAVREPEPPPAPEPAAELEPPLAEPEPTAEPPEPLEPRTAVQPSSAPDLPVLDTPLPDRPPAGIASPATERARPAAGEMPAGLTPGPGPRQKRTVELRVAKPRPLDPIDAEAVYPLGSRLRGEEGAVYLKIRVGADGRVEAVDIHRSSGFAALDRAAERAVRQTRFAPGMRGERPVPGELTITILLRLDS